MTTAELTPPPERTRNRPLAAWRRARAVELAIEGHTYEQIADAVGYSNRGSAHRAVKKALDQRIAEGVDELRRLEVDRLDALQSSLWPQALAGDLAAAGQVLRIINTRSRLLGLMPTGRHKPEAPLEPVTVIIPEGWTWDEQRREWEVTPEALAQHELVLRTAGQRK